VSYSLLPPSMPPRPAVLGRRRSIPRLAPTTVLASLLAWLLATPVAASQVSDLYEAEVPVEDRSAERRTSGIAEALRTVLVKVTGDRSVVSHPGVAADLGQAYQYVQQYRYRPAPEPVTAEPPAEAVAETEPGWLLWARFDAAAVDRLLQARGLPVWGETRPDAVLWLALEDGRQRFLVGQESRPELVAALEQAAAERGVPVLMPLLDLEDRARVRASDVWGEFEQVLVRASARYSATVVLAARAARSGNGWAVQWALYEGGSAEHWRSFGSAVDLALTTGFQQGVDFIADRYAPVAGAGAEAVVRLEVSGIDSVADYAKVARYLRQLTPGERADPERVKPGSIVYRIRIRGGLNSLRQSLALGGVLDPVAEVAPDPRSGFDVPVGGNGVVTEALTGTDGGSIRRLTYRLKP